MSSFFKDGGVTPNDVSSVTSLTNEATASKNAAKVSEDAAAVSATASASSATASATSANSITGSVTSAQAAQTAAEAALATTITHKNTATTQASSATSSASTATTKAAEAATSATNAATSEASSLTNKNAAETSKNSAATSATNSASSASTSSAQATIATNKAADAQKLAVNAEDSQFTLSDGSTTGYSALHYNAKAEDEKTAAAASASTSSAQATIATTKAGEASTSAASAATSASTATTQASNSATSATAANTAKVAAEAALDQFTDVYLGAFSSDPTVDGDGDALTTGDQYFNTASNVLKIYNGSSWQAAALDSTQFVEVDGDTMTGALGITQTGSVSTVPLSVNSNLNSGQAILELRSTTSANATIDLRADGTGDPQILFDLNGVTPFSIGVDNSDGDKFKISGTSQLGTNPRLTIDAAGNSTFGGNISSTGNTLSILPTAAGSANVLLQRSGASNPWYLAQGHTSTNDLEILEGSNSRFRMQAGGAATFNGTVASDTFQNASGNLNILSTGNILLKFDSDNNQTNRELNIQSNSGDQLLRITETGAATFNGATTVDDNLTVTGQVFTNVIGRSNDTNTTIDFPGSDVIQMYTNGVQRFDINSAGAATFSGTVASGKVAITGGTATSEASHATFTNTQGAKTYAVGAGQSGVTNNGFVVRNVTDNSFPLVISDVGASTFAGTVTAKVPQTANTVMPVARITTSGTYNSSGSPNAGGALSFGQYDDSYPAWNLGQIAGIRNGSGWNGDLLFYVNNGTSQTSISERARLNSAGTVLVGKTADTQTDDGHVMFANGAAYSTRTNGFTWLHNLKGNDGEILRFQKDSGTIGSISTISGDLVIHSTATNHKGLRLGEGYLFPTDNAGATSDSTTDLGIASVGRFKDLHLSGTANVAQIDITENTNARVYSSDGIGEVGSGNFAFQAVNAAGNALKPFGFRGEDLRFATALEAMRIMNSGNVGINSTNPQVKLQVNDSGTAASTSGYGTGFNVARADGLIGMTMGYTSANNSTYIQGRNFTNTDTQPITINPLGGNVGIGTTSPSTKLDVKGSVNFSVNTTSHETFVFTTQAVDDAKLMMKNASSVTAVQLSANGDTFFNGGNVLVGSTSNVLGSRAFIESAGSTHVIGARVGANGHYALGAINAAGTVVGGVVVNASSTTYATSSDYRLKENVDYTWDATTRLKQLKPARFNWIADETNTVQDGFLAHEVSSVVPEAVFGNKDAEIQENGDGYQSLDYSKLVPLLVKTIQELEARITALEA